LRVLLVDADVDHFEKDCEDCGTTMTLPKTVGKSNVKYCDPCKIKMKRRRRSESYTRTLQGTDKNKKRWENSRKNAWLKLKANDKARLFKNAKHSARTRFLDFDLTEEDIVIPEICPVLRIPFDNTKISYTMSVDRIDNNLGYVKGNVQVITRKANTMKNDATKEQLLAFADWIYKMYGEKS